jgi:hypothetical protein
MESGPSRATKTKTILKSLKTRILRSDNSPEIFRGWWWVQAPPNPLIIRYLRKAPKKQLSESHQLFPDHSHISAALLPKQIYPHSCCAESMPLLFAITLSQYRDA